MDEIWGCSSKTFCWFSPHHTENARFAVFVKPIYVDVLAEIGIGLRTCALLKFVLAVEKYGLSWSEYRLHRPPFRFVDLLKTCLRGLLTFWGLVLRVRGVVLAFSGDQQSG